MAFPGEPVLRPLLDVKLEGPQGNVHTPLLVDSGSEYSLVTKSFARRIGMERSLRAEYGEPVLIGGQTLRAFLGETLLIVEGFEPVEVTLGFVEKWTFAYAGILGQRGFFDRFGVLFDRPNRRFGLISLDAMDRHFPPPLA